jgi:hypothetical protein
MKKLVSVLLVALLCVCAVSASAAEEQIRLSEMTDGECLEFVETNGIVIPQWYENEIEWVPFIRAVISKVEENPGTSFGFGHTDLLDFAESIKCAVIEYYGEQRTTRALQSSTTNILQDNYVSGSWSNSYDGYNCYAYAIGLTERVNPGDFSGNNSAGEINPYTLAEYIKADLEELGYTGVYISSALHTTSGHEKAICVRTGGWYDNQNWCMTHDYHVMRCDHNGSWYHKPGDTNPLRFKYTPNYKVWVYEAFDGTYYERDDAVRYDSVIWYVMYTTDHHYQYMSNGANQHILTCTVCGQTKGNAVRCIPVNGVCKVCGHRCDEITPVPGV